MTQILPIALHGLQALAEFLFAPSTAEQFLRTRRDEAELLGIMAH